MATAARSRCCLHARVYMCARSHARGLLYAPLRQHLARAPLLLPATHTHASMRDGRRLYSTYQDPYQILGVKPGANKAEVKQAYRSMASWTTRAHSAAALYI